MALPRITQKEMTEREQRELKTLLDRARIAHGRPLSNAETNSVKKEYIDKLMAQREADAKKARQVKKQQAYNLIGAGTALTPVWHSIPMESVTSRAALIVAIFHLHHRALDPGGRRFGLRPGFRLRFGRGVFNQLEQVDQLVIG